MGYTETGERKKKITQKRGVDPGAVGSAPAGAVTTTSTVGDGSVMPRISPMGLNTGGGAMPSSSRILPSSRVIRTAQGLTPNPAEKIPGAFHNGTPPRMVGNFGDRRTSRPILRIPYSPSSTDEAGVKGPTQ